MLLKQAFTEDLGFDPNDATFCNQHYRISDPIDNPFSRALGKRNIHMENAANAQQSAHFLVMFAVFWLVVPVVY